MMASATTMEALTIASSLGLGRLQWSFRRECCVSSVSPTSWCWQEFSECWQMLAAGVAVRVLFGTGRALKDVPVPNRLMDLDVSSSP